MWTTRGNVQKGVYLNKLLSGGGAVALYFHFRNIRNELKIQNELKMSEI